MIIGRSLAATFPPRPAPGPAQIAAPVLEARGLATDGKLVEAGFALRRGEILGVAGLQGMGQQELFLSCFGMASLSQGEIRVDGRKVTLASPRDAVHANIGISLVLIPRNTPGLEVGRRHLPLNVPFQNGPVYGKDLFVPLDHLIGGPAYAGQGWRMLVECLSVGRSISLPSSATGSVRMAALATGAYARIRKQFQMPIGRFEGVEEALARIGGLTYAITALSRMTAAAVDMGEKPSVPSAIAKYHATEVGSQVVKDAMDIHGGKGIILGPRNYLGRAHQAAPISITWPLATHCSAPILTGSSSQVGAANATSGKSTMPIGTAVTGVWRPLVSVLTSCPRK